MAIAPALPPEIKDDQRDVADLWKDALKSYKGIVGFDLERKFDSVQDMLDQGTKEMNNFHRFRHNDKKVDKLRSLFAANLDYIDKGAQQLVAAAVPAFPPAAAIGTAITYMLSACRQVSADYDIVVVFFEDMNSFLQRIVILETRLPKYKAYQNCLMDVFTSFLTMCGFAHKYIELGRFKKWISNLMQGEDSDLGSARKNMDKKLALLQQATEFAILGNTEELQRMSQELQVNQDKHTAMLKEQREVMASIQQTTEGIRTDMALLLKAFNEQKKERSKEQKGKPVQEQGKPASAKRIRNSLPEVEDEGHEYHVLKETMVKDTCAWVFSEPQWHEWLNSSDENRPLLAVTGSPGMGKSHIGATIYDTLAAKAQEDPSKQTCAAHFYFREQHQTLSSFLYAICNVIVQVVEQSAPLCELINTEYQRDENEVDVWVWQDLARDLLAPAFHKDSKNSLFLVLDGIDELDDLASFHEFLDMIHDQNLRISVAVTSRPEVVAHMVSLTNIEITKEKQLPDMKAFVWNRLNTMSALKGFSRYVKQRIADKVEEAAPNLLYAEHMLLRFNILGREGAALQGLDRALPSDLNGFYEAMLAECHRRIPTDYQVLGKALLHWTAFSYRPLVLNEITSLMKHLSNKAEFDSEDVLEPFSKFVRVGDPGTDAEMRAQIQSEGGYGTAVKDLDKSQDASSPDKIYNDGILPVKFLERSMRSFFREPTHETSDLRLSLSAAHQQMFLVCAKLARPVPKDDTMNLDWGLRRYATEFLVHHWRQIDPEKHSTDENAEVMKSLHSMLTNKHEYAQMLESNGPEYMTKFSYETFDRLILWAKRLTEGSALREALNDEELSWWTSLEVTPQKALLELARAHVQRFYQRAEVAGITTSFKAVQEAFEVGQLGRLLEDKASKNFPDVFDVTEGFKTVAVLGVAGVFDDIEMTANAYFAVASILLQNKYAEPAEAMAKKALELCDDTILKTRILELLARLAMKKKEFETASDFICQASELQSSTPLGLKRAVIVTKARIQVKRGQKEEAANLYAEARVIDHSSLTTGNVLQEELRIFIKSKDWPGYVELLKKWSPLERLTWMAWRHDDVGAERHEEIRDVAVKTGESDFFIKFYREAITYLDNVNAGAPIRCALAQLYLEVTEDLEEARKALGEVLDSNSTGWEYPITEDLPEYVLEEAINRQSDILSRLFRLSKDPAVKQQILEEAAGMLSRPLALDIPLGSATYLSDHRLMLAQMYLKLGPVGEFQKLMQEVIDVSIEKLSDKVGWNDTLNLVSLASALHILSELTASDELERVALILFSARFSRLSSEQREDDGESEGSESGSDDEDEEDESSDESEDGSDDSTEESDDDEPPTDEGDLDSPGSVEVFCMGGTHPARTYCWWGGHELYQCVTCFAGVFCESCYEARLAHDSGEKALEGRRYCGKDHEYIRGPIEGWQGVKDGKVMVEGDEPIAFDELLRKIRDEMCKEAWESFWEG